MSHNPPVDAAGDALAEAEAALRVAKTELAVALSDRETTRFDALQLKRGLLAAMEQLALIEQAAAAKVLRKPVARSMAVTAKARASRAAAEALLARNRSVLASLTAQLAGLGDEALAGGGSSGEVEAEDAAAASTAAGSGAYALPPGLQRLLGGSSGWLAAEADAAAAAGDGGVADDASADSDDSDAEGDAGGATTAVTGSRGGVFGLPSWQALWGGGSGSQPQASPESGDGTGASTAATTTTERRSGGGGGGKGARSDSATSDTLAGGEGAGSATASAALAAAPTPVTGSGGTTATLSRARSFYPPPLHPRSGSSASGVSVPGGGGAGGASSPRGGSSGAAPLTTTSTASAASSSSATAAPASPLSSFTALERAAAVAAVARAEEEGPAAAAAVPLPVALLARSARLARALKRAAGAPKPAVTSGGASGVDAVSAHPALLGRVLSFLTHSELGTAGRVCRSWRAATLGADGCRLYVSYARGAAIPPSLRGGLWAALAETATALPEGAALAWSEASLRRLAGGGGSDEADAHAPASPSQQHSARNLAAAPASATPPQPLPPHVSRVASVYGAALDDSASWDNDDATPGGGGDGRSAVPSPSSGRADSPVLPTSSLSSLDEGGAGGRGVFAVCGADIGRPALLLPHVTDAELHVLYTAGSDSGGRLVADDGRGFRFRRLPPPVAVQLALPPGEPVTAALSSADGGVPFKIADLLTAASTAYAGNGVEAQALGAALFGAAPPLSAAGGSVAPPPTPAQLLTSSSFGRYLRAGVTNAVAAAAVAELRTAAARLASARSAARSLLTAIHAAADAGDVVEPATSEAYAAACDALTGAEAAVAGAHGRALDAIQASWAACEAADDALVGTLLASRRAHAAAVARAWAAGGSAGGLVDPAAGAAVPTVGIALPPAPGAAPTPGSPLVAAASSSPSFTLSPPEGAAVSPAGAADASPPSEWWHPLSALPPHLAERLAETAHQRSSSGGSAGRGRHASSYYDGAVTLAAGALHAALHAGAAAPFTSSSSSAGSGSSSSSGGGTPPVIITLGPPASATGDAGAAAAADEERAAAGTSAAACAAAVTRRLDVESDADALGRRSLLVLPGLPFPSQAPLIEADVRRSLGDVERALTLAGGGSDSAAPNTSPPPPTVGALFPTSLVADVGGGSGSAAAADPTAPVPPVALPLLRLRLGAVLLAHAAWDRGGVGYVQGLNFLAALALRHADAPSSWRLLGALLQAPAYGLASLYGEGLAGLTGRLAQLAGLAGVALPRLAGHLARLGVEPASYAAGWLLTLFSSGDVLPVPGYAAPVLGAALLEGWKGVHRVALALLAAVEPDLLRTDFGGALQRLHTLPPHRLPPSPPALLRRAGRVKVTRRMLRLLGGGGAVAVAAAQPAEAPAAVPVAAPAAAAAEAPPTAPGDREAPSTAAEADDVTDAVGGGDNDDVEEAAAAVPAAAAVVSPLPAVPPPASAHPRRALVVGVGGGGGSGAAEPPAGGAREGDGSDDDGGGSRRETPPPSPPHAAAPAQQQPQQLLELGQTIASHRLGFAAFVAADDGAGADGVAAAVVAPADFAGFDAEFGGGEGAAAVS